MIDPDANVDAFMAYAKKQWIPAKAAMFLLISQEAEMVEVNGEWFAHHKQTNTNVPLKFYAESKRADIERVMGTWKIGLAGLPDWPRP